jgi:hypothetical protein
MAKEDTIAMISLGLAVITIPLWLPLFIIGYVWNRISLEVRGIR